MATTIKEIIEDIHLPKVRVRTIPYIEIGDINTVTKKILLKQKPTVSGAKLCPENSVIISRVRPNRGAVGLIDKEMPVSSAFTVLKTKKEKCLPKYLFYYLAWNDNFFSFLQSRATGAIYPTVKEEEILNYPVGYLPNLAEQKRIVATLEEAESLKKKRAEADQKMNELVPALFVKMFGDPVNNEKGWEPFKLKELAKIKTGPFGSLLHFGDYVDGGIPLVNPTHIIGGRIQIDPKLTVTEEKADELNAYRMHARDVVLGRRGEMGRCAMVTEKEDGFLCGTGSLFISPSNQLDQFFLYCVISSSPIKTVLERVAKGVTMKNLNSGNVEDLTIYLPPLELQKQFAEKVKEIEAQKEKQKQSAIQLDMLFSSLLLRVFTEKK